ncbi:MAG: NAD(+) synthase, partial [Candidatus Latescibacterota bacterium]
GIELAEISIEKLVRAYDEALAPLFAGTERGVAEENIQARVRGNLLMALSNKFGWLVLTTGNKSETAVGYCTLYGDMAGGLSILKDVPKTLVYALAGWRNTWPDGPAIPASVIARAPSAELREDQKDSDSLPEYSVLDPILEAYVEHDLPAEEIARRFGDPETVGRVLRLVDANEYKRRQAPPGLKITPKAFGKDRRLPITNGYRPE